MKFLMSAVFVISSTVAFAQNKPMAKTYKVDASNTKITYVGKKVAGEHTGTVTVKKGMISLSNGIISSGEIVVDMNTLSSTDITDKDLNAKYVGHMKSADFFDTAKFPESKLVIKNSKIVNGALEVTGDLTMIGQTKPVTFIVTNLETKGQSLTGKTNLKLNRTIWGLKYGSGSFFKGLGDKAIDDEFTLSIDLSAKL